MLNNKPKPKKIFEPAPLLDAKWIKTPFAYARLSKDLSLMQQQVLLMVSDQLQGYVNQFYADKRNMLPDDPNGLFPRSGDTLPKIDPIVIDLSKFLKDTEEAAVSADTTDVKIIHDGIDRSRYREISAAAEHLLELKIQALDFKDGRPVMKMMPIFDEIKAPLRDIDDDNVSRSNQRVGHIYAEINVKVAEYAFNMRPGYIEHPLHIAHDSSIAYSPRVYFMLKHYLGKSKQKLRTNKECHVIIPYQQVREECGMYERDKDTGEVLKEAFPVFSRFCTYVLDRAQQDFSRMGERNLIDINFDYCPIYKTANIKRGTPEKIEFIITPTKLGVFHSNPKAAVKAAEVADSKIEKRRGRPRKAKPSDPTPDLFQTAEQPVADNQPTVIPGDRVGEWQQVLSAATNELRQLLNTAQYLGTTDGIMTFTLPDVPTRNSVQQLIADQPEVIQIFRTVTGQQFGPYMKVMVASR